mgnify:CR=1 FL=1
MLYCICLVMLVCQVQADAETQVNQSEKIHELSSLGNLSAQQGDIKNAVSYYRDALIVQILLGSEDAEEFMHLFNQYGEAYTRIGLFSLKDQQNKDEYLFYSLGLDFGKKDKTSLTLIGWEENFEFGGLQGDLLINYVFENSRVDKKKPLTKGIMQPKNSNFLNLYREYFP